MRDTLQPPSGDALLNDFFVLFRLQDVFEIAIFVFRCNEIIGDVIECEHIARAITIYRSMQCITYRIADNFLPRRMLSVLIRKVHFIRPPFYNRVACTDRCILRGQRAHITYNRLLFHQAPSNEVEVVR